MFNSKTKVTLHFETCMLFRLEARSLACVGKKVYTLVRIQKHAYTQYVDTRARTHVHARTYTYVFALITHGRFHIRKHACADTRSYVCTETHACTYTHAITHMRVCACTRTHTRTRTRTHVQAHSDAHTQFICLKMSDQSIKKLIKDFRKHISTPNEIAGSV